MIEPHSAILSQDYELFFGSSGSVEKCLFEPCEALMRMAERLGMKITFFVDSGMILKFDEVAKTDKALAKTALQIRRHVERLAGLGHEIALHVHPHWADTRWNDGSWDFSNTRYALRQFSPEEVADLLQSHADCLAEICGRQPVSYRAGGFCIQPFSLLAEPLRRAGIRVDSSIVPGAALRDAVKGFDFSGAPRKDWWRFSRSPLIEDEQGEFLQLPISSVKLPLFYYWKRLWQRLNGTSVSSAFGDGSSKAIGKGEVLRRLAGFGRQSELSVDDAKASILNDVRQQTGQRNLSHVMGHPKLISDTSLQRFEEFVGNAGIRNFETVASAAERLDAGRTRPVT